MDELITRLQAANWGQISASLNDNGCAIVNNVITAQECQHLIDGYTAPNTYRKTVTMERYRFGLGEYRYFQYPLPPLVTHIRQTVYPYLAMVANVWMEVLRINQT